MYYQPYDYVVLLIELLIGNPLVYRVLLVGFAIATSGLRNCSDTYEVS